MSFLESLESFVDGVLLKTKKLINQPEQPNQYEKYIAQFKNSVDSAKTPSKTELQSHTDKWLDLLFLLENYEVTDNNKPIFYDYIKYVKAETDCPPKKLARKINQLLEEKGLDS